MDWDGLVYHDMMKRRNKWTYTHATEYAGILGHLSIEYNTRMRVYSGLPYLKHITL